MKNYYVYILANDKNGTIYIGVTNNLKSRISQHRDKICKGFTSKYKLDKLVYYEVYEDVNDAIHREKQLKNWKRKWKIDLIEKENSIWNDLFDDIDVE